MKTVENTQLKLHHDSNSTKDILIGYGRYRNYGYVGAGKTISKALTNLANNIEKLQNNHNLEKQKQFRKANPTELQFDILYSDTKKYTIIFYYNNTIKQGSGKNISEALTDLATETQDLEIVWSKN